VRWIEICFRTRHRLRDNRRRRSQRRSGGLRRGRRVRRTRRRARHAVCDGAPNRSSLPFSSFPYSHSDIFPLTSPGFQTPRA
jgi:hypothetical protein